LKIKGVPMRPKRTLKGKGDDGNKSDNMSEDNEPGQKDESQTLLCDLTPKMTVFV
jgi:hypothetical protein